MVACGACNHDGIHGMMTMVDALLVESLLQFEGHGRDEVSIGTIRGEIL